jgi:acyl-CoA synthetase (AMP-forming)/AMP-acid ligase II
MVLGDLGCTTHGATMVIPAPGFDPGATLSAVEQERCTALYDVPTMFIAMFGHPDFAARDLSSKLAHYKIPRYVHVVDEFPMTITGKVRKVDMREESVRLLGL